MMQDDAAEERYTVFKQVSKPVPEEGTVRDLLGTLEGLKALDLACGYGHYTRLALELGAVTAVGVDISEEMVSVARQWERETPLGIQYFVDDVARLPRLGDFEVAIAVWLLTYARSCDDMVAMLASIRDNLVPGGRLVAVTIHPDYDPHRRTWEPYGLRVLGAGHDARWSREVETHRRPVTRLAYSRWDRDVYEQAAEAAGFRSLTWHPVNLADGEDNPFAVAVECAA